MFGTRGKQLNQLVADLRRSHPEAGRALASAEGDGVVVLACDNVLAVRRGSEWESHPWQLLQTGGWSRDKQQLHWTTNEGVDGAVVLDDPGRVPEVFGERVQASIVVQRTLDLPEGGQVRIAGRRPVGTGAPARAHVVWQVLAIGRADLDDPATRELVLTTTDELRADYEVV